jgi:hypothetical protein
MKLERERWEMARKIAGVDERADTPAAENGQNGGTTAHEKVQKAYADLSVD